MCNNAISNFGYPGGALSLIAVAVSHATFMSVITHHIFHQVQQAFLRWENGVGPVDAATLPSFSMESSGPLTQVWYDTNVRAHMSDSRACADLSTRARALFEPNKAEVAPAPAVAAQPARSGLHGVPILGAAHLSATPILSLAPSTPRREAMRSTTPSTTSSLPAPSTPLLSTSYLPAASPVPSLSSANVSGGFPMAFQIEHNSPNTISRVQPSVTRPSSSLEPALGTAVWHTTSYDNVDLSTYPIPDPPVWDGGLDNIGGSASTPSRTTTASSPITTATASVSSSAAPTDSATAVPTSTDAHPTAAVLSTALAPTVALGDPVVTTPRRASPRAVLMITPGPAAASWPYGTSWMPENIAATSAFAAPPAPTMLSEEDNLTMYTPAPVLSATHLAAPASQDTFEGLGQWDLGYDGPRPM
jgi:hypothetical protein